MIQVDVSFDWSCIWHLILPNFSSWNNLFTIFPLSSGFQFPTIVMQIITVKTALWSATVWTMLRVTKQRGRAQTDCVPEITPPTTEQPNAKVGSSPVLQLNSLKSHFLFRSPPLFDRSILLFTLGK